MATVGFKGLTYIDCSEVSDTDYSYSNMYIKVLPLSFVLNNTQKFVWFKLNKRFLTRSQAVARIADHTASQQTI